MSERWPILHKYLSILALGVSLTALPFSIFFCHAGFILFILLWASEGQWQEKLLVIKKNILLQLLIGFVFMQLLGMLYTENVSRGWLTLDKKIFLFALPIAFATTRIKLSRKDIRLLLYVFVSSCFIGTLICISLAAWQIKLFSAGDLAAQNLIYPDSEFEKLNPNAAIPWLLLSYISLSKGIALHPSYFSLYLAFANLFLLHEILTQKHFALVHKVLIGFIIFLFTVFIGCLSSKIVVISLSMIYALLAGHYLLYEKMKLPFAAMLFLLVVVFTITYLNPVSHYRNFQEVAKSNLIVKEKHFYFTSVEMRASLWWLGWKSFLKVNPFTGAGTGDVEDLMKETSKTYEITNSLQTNDPHNEYLYVLIGNGIFCLITFCVLLILPLANAWLQQEYLLMGFIFLFGSLCITESALEMQKGVAFFSVFFPLLAFQRASFQSVGTTLKFFSAGS